jgi:hypothetical protein
MATLRHLNQDYIAGSLFNSLEEQRENKKKLCNQVLYPSSDGYYQIEDEFQDKYTEVIFIDDIIDEDTGYTMAYNAKVGTIIPILESSYDRFKDEWLICNGKDHYFKEDYPMLFNKIKDVFYDENAVGDEIPLYINEFVLPNLKPKKLNSNSNEKVIWIIKAGRKAQGNHYIKEDDRI